MEPLPVREVLEDVKEDINGLLEESKAIIRTAFEVESELGAGTTFKILF